MAIFGRSKKSKATTPPLPPQPSINNFYQQPNYPTQYANGSPPNWAYAEQRPNTSTSQLYQQPQPQGWIVAPVPPQYQLVLTPASQSGPPRLPQRPPNNNNVGNISRVNLCSVANLLTHDLQDSGVRFIQNEVTPLYLQSTQCYNDTAALFNSIFSKFDTVMTAIDGERFSGDEKELAVFVPPQPALRQQQDSGIIERGNVPGKSKGIIGDSIGSSVINTNYFDKVHIYANSRLPPNFPPMKFYVPTFPLLSLAARYSERVYSKPVGQERESHVDGDWRLGTKAMLIKSTPMDDMNIIVFAIRGTQSVTDWAVNLKSAPTSPEGFLDDPGNLCHAGFLHVAKKMIKPVAARLRHLLEEDPGRSRCSLLITGHSAGGAVAALLYSHMLSISPQAESELNVLTGFFKRIHCVSFGAPPVSLLPLKTPSSPALRKSIFLSFVNEGDPVPRADKAYVRSLIDLYSSPAPGQSCIATLAPPKLHSLGKSASSLTLNKIRPSPPKSSKSAPPMIQEAGPLWPVPEATLSNAGRIVLLRSVHRYESYSGSSKHKKKKKETYELMNEGVVAQMVSDEILRGVVWGDPVCHMMRLYARRIEILATNAVMGGA